MDDLDQLYRVFAAPLEQLVRREIATSDDVVEDACQAAWSWLADPANRVRRKTAAKWLMTTARREAARLTLGRAPLESLEEQDDGAPRAAGTPEPDEVVDLRRRLDAVALLPRRQQRMLWLHAAGHSYEEIASYTGDTLRTVERQLLRARRSARRLAA